VEKYEVVSGTPQDDVGRHPGVLQVE